MRPDGWDQWDNPPEEEEVEPSIWPLLLLIGAIVGLACFLGAYEMARWGVWRG